MDGKSQIYSRTSEARQSGRTVLRTERLKACAFRNKNQFLLQVYTSNIFFLEITMQNINTYTAKMCYI
jgi:hypothetical protein